MTCDSDKLQSYLDGELDRGEKQQLEQHLGQCSLCRQELTRLKLFWLELGAAEEITPPPELIYLRQRIISSVKNVPRISEDSGRGFWETQRQVWQPALLGASYIPGVETLSKLGRATRKQIPEVLSMSAAMARFLASRVGKSKGGDR